MISYAQNLEDVLLARAFAGVDTGFYIDVGAFDPDIDSVTRHFYDAGWRGINIEPVAATACAVCAERPRDINLNVALGRTDGTLTLPRFLAAGRFDARSSRGRRNARAWIRGRDVRCRCSRWRKSAAITTCGRSTFSRSMSKDTRRKSSPVTTGISCDREYC